ncbi:MAG TPA: DUF1553 domain-containing protein [Pirellulales bacterium]|nr:DUF1553 domain-containing protein [Pirellulales bacterium]
MRAVYLLTACCIALAPAARAKADEQLSFDRDIRPILADKCFKCHGPDVQQRQAELRLDIADGASGDRDGRRPIVPGDAQASELWRRITSTDDSERMPPPSSGKSLSAAERFRLRQWIDQGAEYETHWSLEPPVKRPLPANRNPSWAQTPIDRFVLARLDREGLPPQPEADRFTLARRLSLDLIGLPPSPAEVAAYAADARPDAYERLVDRLLASGHFGECFALEWLDAARYADTNGYFVDNERQMWRWRDWVIAAFNANMPFDQFTVEQLAGDLLPQATLEQQIASGFHRNHPVTNESGIIDEEYRVEYVCDRVQTTATVWLGLTLGCARCHDHKFDPLSQRDFYRMFAFFNNLPEKGNVGRDGNTDPQVSAPLPGQTLRMNSLQRTVDELAATCEQQAESVAQAQSEWQRGAIHMLPTPPPSLATVDCEATSSATVRPQGNVAFVPGISGQAASFDGDSWLELDAPLLPERDRPFAVAAWFLATGQPGSIICRFDDRDDLRGFNVMVEKSMLVVQFMHRNEGESILLTSHEQVPLGGWRHVAVSYHGGGAASGVAVYLDGRPLDMKVVYDSLAGPISVARPWRLGWRSEGYGLKGLIDEAHLYDRTLTAAEVADLFVAERLRYLLDTSTERTGPEKEELRHFFLTHVAKEPWRGNYRRLVEARRELDDFRATVPTAMVMRELDSPREAFVLVRGQYDQPQERVDAGVPTVLPPLPAGARADRLALARWLVDRDQPLTARVIVNRFWHHYFGQGLVGTLNDFGSQGERPTHPELLDWLAVEFVESGWDVKALQRLIVTSAVYRQSSHAPAELFARDPDNRLLARGPCYRLPGELIRDQALAAGGLLVRSLGGPSVKPYQPEGIWEAVSYGGEQSYQPDHGEDLYRRGLYTFWKRQAPPPSLLAFDAPTRETCVVRRSRTNTPLQALVVLNDPTFVEAARKLAERVLKSDCPADDDRLRLAFSIVLSRRPDDLEQAELARLLSRQIEKYRGDLRLAEALLSVGESKPDVSLPSADVAAWTIVAHAILNLDEALSKN